MELIWIAIGILGVLFVSILLIVWHAFIRRQTPTSRLEASIKKKQKKSADTEYELSLREVEKELEASIKSNKEKIDALKNPPAGE